MIHALRRLALPAALCLATAAFAQVPPQANPDQQAMLASGDAHVAANKRLVYDFWREVFEGGHLEVADKYLAEGYIQHNPNVPTGRAGFVTFFGRFAKPKPVADRINAPLVAILGEGDMVVLAFAKENPDPKDATQKYRTTWFDMFRLEGGKIVEHWDPALKQ
jgi:predicted SnoaL-like aldol condensation-catalyzing enzyme